MNVSEIKGLFRTLGLKKDDKIIVARGSKRVEIGVFDIQKGDRVMVAHGKGFSEVDLFKGTRLKVPMVKSNV